MELTLSTPALLFPAISLLMLAYGNRFLAIANLIRNLHRAYNEKRDPIILGQINNLRLRLRMIRDMQTCGALSIFHCVLCMALIYTGHMQLANWVFIMSLALMLVSLGIMVAEIYLSTNALQLELSDIEEQRQSRTSRLFSIFSDSDEPAPADKPGHRPADD